MSKNKHFYYLDLLYLLNLTLLITAGIMIYKPILIFGFIVPSCFFISPINFMIPFVILQIYGEKQLNRTLNNTIFALLIFSLLTYILIDLPAAKTGNNAKPYAEIFGNIFILFLIYGTFYVLGSRLAIKICQKVYDLIKKTSKHIITPIIYFIIIALFDLVIMTFFLHPFYSYTILLSLYANSLILSLFIVIIFYSASLFITKKLQKLEEYL